MKVRVVRVFIASLAVSTLFATSAFTVPVFAEPQSQIEALENQKKEVQAQASDVNAQLVSLLVDYKALQKDIESQQLRIEEVGQDLETAKANEQKQYADMKLRIKYMYENGDASFAEAILTATSYTDLVNKSEYVEKVHGYDRDKLTEYIQTKEAVASLKEELEGEQADMESMAQEMSSQQANLESTLTVMRAQIVDFDNQLASAQAEAEAEVMRMQEEQQLAQRKNESQAGNVSKGEKLASTGNSSGNSQTKPSAGNSSTTTPASGNTGSGSKPSGGTTTSGNAGTTKPGGGTTTPSTGSSGSTSKPGGGTTTSSTGNSGSTSKPSGGTTTSSTGSSGSTSKPGGGTTTKPSAGSSSNTSKPSNSATGQKIANKGCEYVGNPYVYGGDSLTEGIDCSGFVHQIHAKFGISTPRTSGALRTGGKAVDVSDMLPGDVICYSGHVAIYIGGGQIVHASNSKPYPAGGIKISSAYYKTILAVRRYW